MTKPCCLGDVGKADIERGDIARPPVLVVLRVFQGISKGRLFAHLRAVLSHIPSAAGSRSPPRCSFTAFSCSRGRYPVPPRSGRPCEFTSTMPGVRRMPCRLRRRSSSALARLIVEIFATWGTTITEQGANQGRFERGNMFLVAPGHPKEVGALRLCARDGGPEPGPQIIPPGKTYPPEKVRPPKVLG